MRFYTSGVLNGKMEHLMTKYIEIVFDGPPNQTHKPGLVEIEDESGLTMAVGQWFERRLTSNWALRITLKELEEWDPNAAKGR